MPRFQATVTVVIEAMDPESARRAAMIALTLGAKHIVSSDIYVDVDTVQTIDVYQRSA